MNYLAHMLCSDDTPASMLGNFLADFVKGHVEGRFPCEVVEGIRRHREADCFTDSHEVFGASRRLVSAPRRRYAGVIIDVVYDHFLTTSWDRYSSRGLDEFVGLVYENLGQSRVAMPHPVPLVIERMAREDWLRSYGTADGIDQTFRRISRRLTRENPLATAVEELERNYDLLRDHFHSFFPQVLARFGTALTHGHRSCPPSVPSI
ncbi:MAG TPA: ACP phosphodiesterase [Nitrospirota bacterium]|nr:ACP phosphodiesterase [Nitrospirota bacterium]HSB33916.1 ACP phosphodiesterase [Nitrospirota bacterium]